MHYKYYLIATIILIITPLIIITIPKYIFLINILAILFIVNGYMNFDKYIFLLILCVLLFRFIFMDKNKDKNKKGVVEYFDDDDADDANVPKDDVTNQENLKKDETEYMDETGIEEFLIKDKFSKLHDIIHEYQNALERNKTTVEKNPEAI